MRNKVTPKRKAMPGKARRASSGVLRTSVREQVVVVDVTFISSKKLRDTTVEETQETDSLEYSLAFSHNSYSYPLTLLVLYVLHSDLICIVPW